MARKKRSEWIDCGDGRLVEVTQTSQAMGLARLLLLREAGVEAQDGEQEIDPALIIPVFQLNLGSFAPTECFTGARGFTDARGKDVPVARTPRLLADLDVLDDEGQLALCAGMAGVFFGDPAKDAAETVAEAMGEADPTPPPSSGDSPTS
jgi:hypothetical protein